MLKLMLVGSRAMNSSRIILAASLTNVSPLNGKVGRGEGMNKSGGCGKKKEGRNEGRKGAVLAKGRREGRKKGKKEGGKEGGNGCIS
jgi:hypothetical protein